LSDIAEAYNKGAYSYYDKTGSHSEIGVYYILEGESGAQEVKEINWVALIREFGKLFPGSMMYVIEYYRNMREKKNR
ncbi:MAG: hypothetical protein AAB681_02470, partial [Patescibacteria group bacterium]